MVYIVRSTILPRVILSGTKWSRTPKGCAKHRIYEGKHKSMEIKSLPLEGKVPNEMRRMRCRMRSIRDLNITVIKNNAVCDGYTSSVAFRASFPSRGSL